MKTGGSALPCLALAGTLGACGGILTSDQPPEHEYWLEAATLELGEPSASELPDLVVSLHTVPGLDTDRILLKGPGARMNHYAGARWPDHLPEVMAALVRLSLESSGRFARVSSRSHSGGEEWSLELELREFFAVAGDIDRPPRVHVQIAGYLDCGMVRTAVRATASTASQENSLSRIVAAFQSATDDALLSLGQQLQASCL